ncbi:MULTISPECIES: cell division protein ZipA C-terminal FtsZ-binding domain-containing protein [unclassified Acinetobacter]|uniref:cell division protein ZipA C-terminal FtsZ-binding domain-containing protein n=1 Tax=unclassified Acinetobacter TaxID=196816 RepID=UPI0015D1F921|nr:MULTISPECIES: cell division protein ZipA C-terminal FtsZ-binding domain-containing protein [unclassified Acinetobacter]UUS58259.1 cell division protein ZipA [Acinetobacter sp. YH16040_T]
MEITTIAGIVIAVIIMVVGIRMMFRKPADAAPSLDTELHIDPDSQQPVIPRHVRNQLNTPETTQRVEPTLAEEKVTAVETTEAVQANVTPEAMATEQAEQSVEAIAKNETTTTDPVSVEKAQTATEDNTLSTETTESATVATVATDANHAATPATNVQADAVPAEKAPEFSVNSAIEKAEISDFDEESSILDAHLHEQKIVDEESALATAETYIALNVFPDSRALSGEKALKVLLKYGLRFGEMACFHRYDEEGTKLLFSVLQMNNDGAAQGFDLETLSTEEVKGLAFFLALPHSDVQNAFDTMDSISRLIAREIDGTVYDQNNQEFTPQMREHWRHQAIDYRQGQAIEV